MKDEKPKYCQDCKHYDREAVARREEGCAKYGKFINRKNYCEDWTN